MLATMTDESSDLPPLLTSLYATTASTHVRYDAIHFSESHARAVLERPLARRIFGQTTENDSIHDGKVAALREGKLSFPTFVADGIEPLLAETKGEKERGQLMSEAVHIAAASLLLFLQHNVTGPPPAPSTAAAAAVLPPALRVDSSSTEAARCQILHAMTVDGVALGYSLMPWVELLAAARGVCEGLMATKIAIEQMPAAALAVQLRVRVLWQKMMGEITGSLQNDIYADLEALNKMMSREAVDNEEQARFLLERATIHMLHGLDANARVDLEAAGNLTGFQWALTGRLGKRTKFQDRDISQLVVLAKSAEEPVQDSKAAEPKRLPKNLNLNDDTLLESIAFQSQPEKSMTVQPADSLPPALSSLDPASQPRLSALDSIILLSFATAITNTSPQHGLTREETLPYVVRVIDGGSPNWQVYSQALLVRSKIENYRTRTVERGLLQLQALVDQVIADTSPSDASAATDDTPTTFLPRPTAAESAPSEERLRYVWQLSFSTRWALEAELAGRWVSLGGLRSALEIYERLHMWAEAALCYAATDRENDARRIVRQQLYQQSGNEEGERYDGPEHSPLPPDAPRLLCFLGDIDTDPSLYQRAWDVSNCRYARAQRSLARHYLRVKPRDLDKAAAAYRASLHIDRHNHPAWFALGCVELELENWPGAAEAFSSAVRLEGDDAEAWSNLAAALINMPLPSQESSSTDTAPRIPLPDEDESMATQPATPALDPHARQRAALNALSQAARYRPLEPRIWDNILTVAAAIPPPATPFNEIVIAMRHVIDLRSPKMGERAIDVSVLTVLIDVLTATSFTAAAVRRRGSLPFQILSLLDDAVVPLITASSALWLLMARVETWRERPAQALAAHEKAWRVTLAAGGKGGGGEAHAAFEMGDAGAWKQIVSATEVLVREGYVALGMKQKEKDEGNENGEEKGDVEGGEMVAPDWRFKSRSAVRSVMGKGRELYEGDEGWERLVALGREVMGGN